MDEYIAKAAEFARPILAHIRELVHKACPEARETIKWSVPHFEHQGILCNMATFKAHCAFGFWRGNQLKIEAKNSSEAMGDFGRITSLADLPSDKVLVGYIREAARLNESGLKRPKAPKAKVTRGLVVPESLIRALKKNRKAADTFNGFSNSHKKEYAEWIATAKTEQTREKRVAQAIAWLTEGKSRNWKYQRAS